MIARMSDRTVASAEGQAVGRAMDWIALLAGEVGPRRPTSRAERVAAELMREQLAAAGLAAAIEPFRGYPSFAAPFGVTYALALLPALLPRRRSLARAAVSGTGAAALVGEGSLVHTPLSAILARRPSQNVVATVEPREAAVRTLCLVCHLDSSRSGLLFHPRTVRHVNTWIALQAIACLALPAEPLLTRRREGRALVALSRALAAVGAALLVERELRGEDVAGANDNASGSAVAAQLAAECAADPLESTRVVLLMTGCEESGLLGAQAFLRGRDTSGWLFLNFDSIGGPATLRYMRREGLMLKWDADPALVAIAERVAGDRPELELRAAEGPIGLTYDVTPVLARGGRGLSLVAGNGTIPNYHWPTDTVENVDRGSVARALEVGREMVAAVDRGEADRPV